MLCIHRTKQSHITKVLRRNIKWLWRMRVRAPLLNAIAGMAISLLAGVFVHVFWCACAQHSAHYSWLVRAQQAFPFLARTKNVRDWFLDCLSRLRLCLAWCLMGLFAVRFVWCLKFRISSSYTTCYYFIEVLRQSSVGCRKGEENDLF